MADQPISAEEVNGRIEALIKQRNKAMDDIVLLQGVLAVQVENVRRLQEENKELQAKLDEGKPRLSSVEG